MSYSNDQVSRVLNDAYHRREQLGSLTAAVTTKFQNTASTDGVDTMITALKDTVHVDHADAVAAFAELIG